MEQIDTEGFKQAYKSTMFGDGVGVEVKVLVRFTGMNENFNEVVEDTKVSDLFYKLSKTIEDTVYTKNYEKTLSYEVEQYRTGIADCFAPHSIFVEELPNRYSSDPYFQMFPWFKVTTKIGHFIVGRRKRVYHVEWKETIAKGVNGRRLFIRESETNDVGENYIHAWNLKELKEFIQKIIDSVNV